MSDSYNAAPAHTMKPMASARLGTVEERTAAQVLLAFDITPVSLSISDVHGTIVGGNQAFWTLFGHEPGSTLTVAMLARPADHVWTSTYLEQMVAGESHEFRSGKRFMRADGSEFDAEVSIRPLIDAGVCVGMVAAVEPIAIRPKIDDARIRKLLEHSAGTLALIDGNGVLVETTGRYRSTLGYPNEFWENRTIFDVLVPEDADLVAAMRQKVIGEPGREVTGDLRVITADQSIEILEVVATNLLEDPDVQGVVITSRNVTTQRADSSAVAEIRDEAVAEAESRSHLLATVSHELRNPLHAMTGMAELLASDSTLSTDQHELARAIQRQLLQLADVTDDLLDTAQLDVGELRLRPTAVNVRELVDDILRPARSVAEGRLTVTSSVSDEVPSTITADPTRLQQVISNLVGNAVKFTDHGSVHLGVDRNGKMLTITVADTGPGIPLAQQQRVFEAFSSVPNSGNRRGAGLGLAIVQRLVRAMGGTIDLRSEPGNGTTFTTTLPLIEDLEQSLPTGDASESRPDPETPVRVLVIEDTPVNQDLARAQLARLGMECVISVSAEDGLDVLAREQFDAVLMDHQLPGMNGRDATREIRARGWTVPVIGVTASSTAADERACLEAGMDAFLPKPVGLNQLRTALDRVLRLASSDPQIGDDATPDVTALPSIEVKTLERLVDELGDRSIVHQLVRSFLDELEARSDDIGSDDEQLAARQAHTLKSSAALLGAMALSRACAAAEHDAAQRGAIAPLAQAARIDLLHWLDTTPSGAQ